MTLVSVDSGGDPGSGSGWGPFGRFLLEREVVFLRVLPVVVVAVAVVVGCTVGGVLVLLRGAGWGEVAEVPDVDVVAVAGGAVSAVVLPERVPAGDIDQVPPGAPLAAFSAWPRQRVALMKIVS